ncbi:uncharacterized protein SPAPADRAFT_62998 [Spathaspora passalidarum NRRL Y-27907]|uniref:Serine hydrolase domain-containing protein n=1 Tax=Spathaspora passalidarum (strain NRRL Y-27907 / 11-Y1) TaxID=619300 RepID=G3ASF3_SPAPN|nr:uncharacterized protein SPAPADRAFT_62998 [Spathaspora passalidarum NRRL Y-27907]EGW31070.1 hypothetical protein SPAPADRAFT_62998 [Spathaspora passalidarum NRRL Y-27907]
MSQGKKQYKGKILFLHGYTQSASLFYAKTSALRKKLIKLGYKSVYLNGPYVLTPAQLPSTDSLSKFSSAANEDMKYRAWWVKRDSTNDRISLEESIESIRNYIDKGEIIADSDDVDESDAESEEEKKLPIVGIIGFSQGAALGGLVAHKFDEIFKVDPLKFVILYSGFKLNTTKKSGNDRYDHYYPEEQDVERINLKYLHIYGELDTVVEESRALSLYELTKRRSDLLRHPGGHFVPNSKLYIDQVTNWIHKVEQEDKEEDKEKNEVKNGEDKDKHDLATLMDMMDSFGTI